MIPPVRKLKMEQSYLSIGPFIQKIVQVFRIRRGVAHMLDVGSGEGFMALRMAEDFGAAKIILTDIKYPPIVELPHHAKFYKIDALSPKFLEKFQNEINLVTCLNTFHELEDPLVAAGNLLRVLPLGGITLILEYSEEGWARQSRIISTGGTEQERKHHADDLQLAKKNKFDTNDGIRKFWEQEIFPRVPGECFLTFNADLYTVIYLARQWGEVKEPPPDIRKMIEELSKAS